VNRALVEHLFRHEFGRLGAVLTRSLGVRRLALVEDVVQAALVQALETWSRRGVPEDPAGWLYRTARNLAIDALRRERTPRQGSAWPKTPSPTVVFRSAPCLAGGRRSKRISPTRSATNRFACSSSAATKRRSAENDLKSKKTCRRKLKPLLLL
jgi:DNA-directed RNA polymerase specialized sigma24 family protein